MKIAATYPPGDMIDLDDPELIGIACDGEVYCVACAKKAAAAGGLKERGYGPNFIGRFNVDPDETCGECGEPLL